MTTVVLFVTYALTLGIPRIFAISPIDVMVLPELYSTNVCVSLVIWPSSWARSIMLSAGKDLIFAATRNKGKNLSHERD